MTDAATATRIAFYAPMKSPRHPVPSGDREMARNLMAIIAAVPQAVVEIDLATELKIFDKHGDAALQARLRSKAAQEVARLVQEMPRLDLWVTYHNYYKAPDLIGPQVARARGIPYVQIESTRALRRLKGPWAGFAQSAHDAADAADLIFYLTANDLITLERERYHDQQLELLPPFLPMDQLPTASSLSGQMLSVGMMRPGDKLASYQIIADSLRGLDGDWQLQIVGDGPARADVAALMAPFGHRVTFLGELSREDLAQVYAEASLFFWPGVNEAFGMVYLEAQSHGLPVVAQDRPGMRDILAPGVYPDVAQGAAALRHRLQTLLHSPDLRRNLGTQARNMIARTHLAPAASHRFGAALARLLKEQR